MPDKIQESSSFFKFCPHCGQVIYRNLEGEYVHLPFAICKQSPLRDGGKEMSRVKPVTFEKFATDHQLHVHCVGCGGCILDPNAQPHIIRPVWCVGCVKRIDASMPPSAERPWHDGIVFSGTLRCKCGRNEQGQCPHCEPAESEFTNAD